MKKKIAFISILLFLILLWYTKGIYNDCCNNDKVVKKEKLEEIEVKTIQQNPLIFKPNSSVATTNPGWEELRNEILSGKSNEKILQIIAPYLKNETEEIGITRAKNAYIKLEADLDTAKIEYKAYLLETTEPLKSFSGAKFNWLTQNDNVEELDDNILIYFPNNSTKKIENPNITNYLKKIAKQITGTNKNVYLSGYSDNVGDFAKNKALSLKRANSVKAELILLGLDKDQIIITAYGEEQPIANNNTPEGREKNRRVELQIK